MPSVFLLLIVPNGPTPQTPNPFIFHFSPFTASLPFPLAVDIDGVPLSL
jgi:hypothetical protein